MILITGATSGIGKATAERFARAGQKLILLGRRKDRLEALRAELSQKVETHTFSIDVRQPGEIHSWAKEQSKLLKEVTVLINNAGLAQGLKPLQDYEAGEPNSDAMVNDMIDTNVKGLLTMTRVMLPHFIKNQKGHVINVGSTAGHFAYPGGNVYCATKAAVKMLTECMRMDLNGTGVRVTEISPGMVETEFSQVRFSGDKKRAGSVYQGMTPLSADDIAETIFWCSDRPQHVNIQEIVIYPTDQASPTLVKREI
jgi:serine 3-dehydrogenase